MFGSHALDFFRQAIQWRLVHLKHVKDLPRLSENALLLLWPDGTTTMLGGYSLECSTQVRLSFLKLIALNFLRLKIHFEVLNVQALDGQIGGCLLEVFHSLCQRANGVCLADEMNAIEPAGKSTEGVVVLLRRYVRPTELGKESVNTSNRLRHLKERLLLQSMVPFLLSLPTCVT